MVKVVFLDFYGTVVHEDGEVIQKITQMIADTGNCADKSKIGGFWWSTFQAMYTNAYGDNFETQRELEYQSLIKTLKEFESDANAKELSQMMFEHWVKPPIFNESKEFFQACPLPIYIVSNIDTSDVWSAVKYHGLKPSGIFTSEDARSYKPRGEIFQLALNTLELNGTEVVHIGDSISSDVKGAKTSGIHALWLNRFHKEVPEGVSSIANLMEAYNTCYFK